MTMIDNVYRWCSYARIFIDGIWEAICAIMCAMAIGKGFNNLREEVLDNYDDWMMNLAFAVIVCLFARIGISIYLQNLEKKKPDGYYCYTFCEAYRRAKKGIKFESTSGIILEVGPDGKPMLTKDGSEVSGKTFKFDIAYDVYWRRVSEEMSKKVKEGQDVNP